MRLRQWARCTLLILVLFTLFGGVGMYVQTWVAQAYGEGQPTRAARAVSTGCWSALLLLPFFVLLAGSRAAVLNLFQLSSAAPSLISVAIASSLNPVIPAMFMPSYRPSAFRVWCNSLVSTSQILMVSSALPLTR